MDLYINLLPKVSKMCRIYLFDNERVIDLLNDIIFIIGKNYRDYLMDWLVFRGWCFFGQCFSGVSCLRVLLEFFAAYNPRPNLKRQLK